MPSTFHTLEREEAFRNPSATEFKTPLLQEAVRPHVDSFNNIFEHQGKEGLLHYALKDIGPMTYFDRTSDLHEAPDGTPLGNKFTYWIEDPRLFSPAVQERDITTLKRQTYPSECRERSNTYRGRFQVKLCWRVNDGPMQTEIRELGQVPIMVRSNRCHLKGMFPKQLVEHHEDPDEAGGYFIVNGIEKLVRLLIVPRRNHATALQRTSYQKRGPNYSSFGVYVRSARRDETTLTNTVHYLNDGNVMFRFAWRKQEYLIPVLLIIKCLVDVSDKEIFDALCQGDVHNTFLTDRVELMLRSFKEEGCNTHLSCLAYLGDRFRVVMGFDEDMTDIEIGREMMRRLILVHLDEDYDKFNMMIYMIRKLYAVVSGACAPDNPDAAQHQEVLTGGHLYAMILKEKLHDWLYSFQQQFNSEMRFNKAKFDLESRDFILKTLRKVPSDIGQKMSYFLATGNLVSKTGLDLQQFSGFTIVAEKLNFYRFISHFRCIHRGAFFATLKTTSVRKLRPEGWGFLCPVHTPDGAPCGLLNHLAHKCKVVTDHLDTDHFPKLLSSLGVSQAVLHSMARPDDVPVMLDGRVVGWCTPKTAAKVAQSLKVLRTTGEKGVPFQLEVALVPTTYGGEYPGLYLFSGLSRMMRPVKYLGNGNTDMVGTFEQVYMDIACMDDEVVPGVTTHQDFAPTDVLSIIANMTPFSDFNQSPRNMYQCQMGKQTMGTPSSSFNRRTDNKMYRIQTGQTPVVRPNLHNDYGLDGYPQGANAIVAVISYTGYDMEDAMILNKSAHERGFGYGTVYKSELVDLSTYRNHGDGITHQFGLDKRGERACKELLGHDGLPHVGVLLRAGDPLYSFVDVSTGSGTVKRYKGPEDAFVDEIRVLGSDNPNEELQRVQIKLRIPRSPVIGDKFSSRHGQKGVCSQKWPAVDMPFTESGMQPDVIINPHAFPSRMTIGMFVESLAGKAGALHGMSQDSTPFKFNETYTAADYFGEQLLKAGYNYHGNEPMYSGITGEELRMDIYIGVVFYQRLRHMVNDKFQVRTTGPVHNLTQQPVKGRKRAGGIRFGEMERDSLLAHGTSFLLQDRLMNCSDYSQAHVCRLCGSVLSPICTKIVSSLGNRRTYECRTCQTSKGIDMVALPYVFRYLSTELISMGIRMNLGVKP
ncbi:beta and beta-prime subunits of DNA dependent RNA-polymerase [Hesseltinella vesiculosa]|uniref:DNA-directed RNA polymerase subunit beta n=1 Tax=Hesseltinella vesiculosa TaxID=101127 RepID=A0A1X2GLZ4_9FUNG|nr:beta and beta-prime subunits of DNA dependent RNA-polymerase [Hesseltinella vesiculosa]